MLGYSTIACATTLFPNEPGDLKVTTISNHQINLSWKDNSDNEKGFSIARSVSGGSLTVIDTVGPDITTYEDKGLSAATKYCYHVYAIPTKKANGGVIVLSACATTSRP